jgi:hypothetical protein
MPPGNWSYHIVFKQRNIVGYSTTFAGRDQLQPAVELHNGYDHSIVVDMANRKIVYQKGSERGDLENYAREQGWI